MTTNKVFAVLLYPPAGNPRVAEVVLSFKNESDYKKQIKRGYYQLYSDMPKLSIFDSFEKAAFALNEQLQVAA